MENLLPFKSSSTRNWFVIYTRPRWEKKVDQLLQMQDITSYCPVRKVKSQWADRIKEVELPLFSSYVFVYINPKEELKVRLTMGVVNFIYYMGKMARIRESVIEDIKHYLESYPEAEVEDIRDMEVGDRVKIKEGIMTDKEGQIIKLHGKNVLVVIDNLNCALVTKVSVSALELIN
ncbi:UpxY family transcription antiterminator [Pedobacter frigoris]|uniref:UpxY family transcription antiterminator n=1 Tax=Pedobacter frigoris TaxID=2571272 RepID=A0A4U1CCJ9_9SPHI|nr:UpxY family transcription antiterminator [Pedobacter frigoris]TKC03708.1 UpxY family transcription antiterminator [Pedobacter frigoris]